MPAPERPDPSDAHPFAVSAPIKPLTFDHLYEKIVSSAERKVQGERELEKFLAAWWCKTYQRPYKDPLLLSYTMEELLCEYLDASYRANPEAFKNAKVAEKQRAEDDSWAERMAKKLGAEFLPDEQQAKAAEEFAEAHQDDGLVPDEVMNQSVRFDLPDD